MTNPWTRVRAALETADSITWEGCHKIYVLMDAKQTALMQSYGYETVPVEDADYALATVADWYEDSCGLRFVSAVQTVSGDPNDGFVNLISQFEDEEEE